MSQSSDRAARDERLHAALHRGDPVAGEPDLAPEEVRTMRRIVLTAVPEERRGFRLMPAFAAVAAVALLLGWVLWQVLRTPETSARPIVAERPAPVGAPAPKVPETSVEATPAPAPPTLEPGRPKRRPGRSRVPDPIEVAKDTPNPEPLSPDSDPPRQVLIAEEPLTRQVQFDTPGGTRVIWMLTEESHSR